MISYALITKDKISHSIESILSVKNLPKHEHEFIVHCPMSAIQDDTDHQIIERANLKVVEDSAKRGSPYAFNNILHHVQGKYVSYLLNNIIYPTNLLDIISYLDGEGKQKKIKLVNLMWEGGPGLLNLNHADSHINGVLWEPHLGTPVTIENTPYPIIPLPFVEIDTIAKYLEGHIFHPEFKNHYPDHWLGFYISRHETYKPFSWSCPGVQYKQSNYQRVSSCSTDHEDSLTLRSLTDKYLIDKNMRYTDKI